MIFNMVGGAGGGTTEGMYCWAKSLKETSYPALTFTGVTFTPTGNAYNIVANSGDGWGRHIIHSAEINADSAEVEIVYVPNTLQATWFIGFAESAQTQYANITHSVMLEAGQIKRYNGANLVGQIGTFAAGDTIRIKIANGTFSVYKADTSLNSFSISLSKLVLNATFYQGGKDYGTIECSAVEGTDKGYVLSDDLNAYPQDGYGEDGFYYKRLEDNIPWHEAGSYVWAKSDADSNLIAYVVSDNPSEFPEDGQGDDGYYYKLQEMGVSFKYASGSGSTPSSSYDGARFVVSGVAFRPKTIFLTWNATGQVNNTIVADFNGTVKQTNSYNGSTITITDDGFTFFTNSGLYPSNTLSYSWMATGV